MQKQCHYGRITHDCIKSVEAFQLQQDEHVYLEQCNKLKYAKDVAALSKRCCLEQEAIVGSNCKNPILK